MYINLLSAVLNWPKDKSRIFVELLRIILSLRCSSVNKPFVFEYNNKLIDDISVGNALGYNKNDRNFLATHFNFDIFFNKEQGVWTYFVEISNIFLIENHQSFRWFWWKSSRYWYHWWWGSSCRIHLFSKLDQNWSHHSNYPNVIFFVKHIFIEKVALILSLLTNLIQLLMSTESFSALLHWEYYSLFYKKLKAATLISYLKWSLSVEVLNILFRY